MTTATSELKSQAIEFLSNSGHSPILRTTAADLYLLYGEFFISMQKGDISTAKDSLETFTTVLKQKIAADTLSKSCLFCAIRLTEASSAGVYKVSDRYSLTAVDMTQLWSLVKSVPFEKWEDQTANGRQMVRRATGEY